MGNKQYTDIHKRVALSSAYQILCEKRNQTQHASSLFGMSEDGESDLNMSLADVMNCLALLHNDMKAKEDEPNV